MCTDCATTSHAVPCHSDTGKGPSLDKERKIACLKGFWKISGRSMCGHCVHQNNVRGIVLLHSPPQYSRVFHILCTESPSSLSSKKWNFLYTNAPPLSRAVTPCCGSIRQAWAVAPVPTHRSKIIALHFVRSLIFFCIFTKGFCSLRAMGSYPEFVIRLSISITVPEKENWRFIEAMSLAKVFPVT